jgi:hypothetical protein
MSGFWLLDFSGCQRAHSGTRPKGRAGLGRPSSQPTHRCALPGPPSPLKQKVAVSRVLSSPGLAVSGTGPMLRACRHRRQSQDTSPSFLSTL